MVSEERERVGDAGWVASAHRQPLFQHPTRATQQQLTTLLQVAFPAGLLPPSAASASALAALGAAAAQTLENDDPFDSASGSVLEAAWGFTGGGSGLSAAPASAGGGIGGGNNDTGSGDGSSSSGGSGGSGSSNGDGSPVCKGGTQRPQRTGLAPGDVTIGILLGKRFLREGVCGWVVSNLVMHLLCASSPAA
jgi:hypothetical protein